MYIHSMSLCVCFNTLNVILAQIQPKISSCFDIIDFDDVNLEENGNFLVMLNIFTFQRL